MMLRRLLRGPASEDRALSYQSVWGAGGSWPGESSWSGAYVSEETSLSISTVYSCVRLYCDTLSTLPAAPFFRQGGERKPWWPRPGWLDEPDTGVLWGDYVQQGSVSLLLDGNWFSRIYRNTYDEPVALVVLDPLRVEVRRNATGAIEYVWDQSVVIPARDMLHITELRLPGALRGVSRITQLRQTLGLSQALTEFSARFFSNGSVTSGVIETPAALNQSQAEQARDVFEASHRGGAKSNRVAVLGGGATFKKTGVDPDQAQMLGSKAQSIEDIARIFRVPPQKIGITTPGSMSYASVEQMNIAWTTDSVRPYVSKIENAHSRLLPGGAFLRLNMDALLRGDTTTRYAAYSTALQSGWAAINDVRKLEDMPSIDGGDMVRVPLANVDLPAANVVEQEKNVAMAATLIAAGADPAATLAAFGLPALPFTDPTQGATP